MRFRLYLAFLCSTLLSRDRDFEAFDFTYRTNTSTHMFQRIMYF